MAQVKLQHSLVNSGNEVILESTKVTFSMKMLNEAKPIPGKFDIVENEYGGFENPKIILDGFIDIDDIPTNGLTQNILVSFAIMETTTPIILTVESGSSTTALKGRPTDGYSTNGTNTLLSSINFVIDSYTIMLANSSDLGHFWKFNIIGHETI